MKASIRRHGIVLRTIELTGNLAKIGSGEQCEIRIDDPYLAAHVADVIRRADGWSIADAATSLEGVTRGGSRIEEEKVVAGEPYMVGGFELVFEGAGAVAPMSANARTFAGQPEAGVLPRTIVEQPLPPGTGREVPKTMMDTPLPQGTPASAPAGPQFRPMQTAHNVPVPPPHQQQYAQHAPGVAAAPPKKRRTGLLLVAVLGVLMVLLLVVILAAVGGRKKSAKPKAPTASQTPAPTQTAPPPPTADPVKTGDTFAASLEMDKALASWEQAIEKTPNPELQKKYARAALDLALVYAAANDTARSREHLEKVAKFGPPESDEVRMAKAKLGQ